MAKVCIPLGKILRFKCTIVLVPFRLHQLYKSSRSAIRLYSNDALTFI